MLSRKYSIGLIFQVIAFYILSYSGIGIGDCYSQEIKNIKAEIIPCTQLNTSTKLEFFSSIGNEDQLMATDLFVEPNEIFTMDQIVTNLWSLNGVQSLDIIFWSDDQGKPGSIVFSELATTPTSQTFVTTNQGGNVYETVIDMVNPVSLAGNTNGETYWVQLFGYANTGTAVGWHITNQSVTGYNAAVNSDGMGWIQSPFPEDMVYAFSGECTSILSTTEVAVNHIRVYPNPTNGTLNISNLNNMEILEYILYNSNGIRMTATINNNMLDISQLESGMYFLYLKTPIGNVTKKIVKY
jgi:hypothetical protein